MKNQRDLEGRIHPTYWKIVDDWNRLGRDKHIEIHEHRGLRRQRIALLPEDWPEVWRAALPALGRRVRRGEVVLVRLMPRTRDAVVQAVGMCAGARAWAAWGIVLGDAMDADLVGVVARYLLIGRQGLARDGRGLPRARPHARGARRALRCRRRRGRRRRSRSCARTRAGDRARSPKSGTSRRDGISATS